MIKLVHGYVFGGMFGEHASDLVFTRTEDLLVSVERFRFCSFSEWQPSFCYW